MITVNIDKPIKVKFIKEIFEDDFVEAGMTALLTGVEWDTQYNDCYKLFFDFSPFEEENATLFPEVYWPNQYTRKLAEETGCRFFTAKESKQYDPTYWVYFFCGNMITRDDKAFEKTITDFLTEV